MRAQGLGAAIPRHFRSWCERTAKFPAGAADIAEPVRHLIDPQNRGRQYVATCLGRLVGTRVAGYLLTWQEAVGAWARRLTRWFAPTPRTTAA
jgi:hypothetical protein